MQCVDAVHRFDHPDVAPLMVMIEYMAATEGPLWRSIRGQGLAYGFSLRLNIEEGTMYFGLSQASQLLTAFDTAAVIVAEFCAGTRILETPSVEAAIASVIFETVSREQSPEDACTEAAKKAFYGAGGFSNVSLLARVQAVTVADL